jgi:hypothetical protein
MNEMSLTLENGGRLEADGERKDFTRLIPSLQSVYLRARASLDVAARQSTIPAHTGAN